VSEADGKVGTRTLEGWAERFGMSLSSDARDRLLEFAQLLLAWGGRINLTAARSVGEVIADHFPDSFAIAARLAARSKAPNRIIDVGSGGGLPAIPLALLRPDDRFTMVEATGKKVAFLRTAIRELALGDRMRVEHRRVEGAEREVELFDVATSRAMLAPPEWMLLARNLVRVGGVIFCLGTRGLERVGEGLRLIEEEPYRSDRWVAELVRST
jgi:16S rRNA (guanine527-N7)-methyltransferase